MSYFKLLYKNAFRNKFRTVLTIAGMAVAVLAFLFLRTVVDIWNGGVADAAQDRLAMRNKVSITMTVPRTYYNRIKDNVPDVTGLTYANWFGGAYPPDERNFFAKFAVDGDTYFDVFPELLVPPEQMRVWRETRDGVIVGDKLAQKYGWKIGDKVIIRGDIYPGDWSFTVCAFYTTTSKAFDRFSFVFHYEYLNQGLPELRREQIGWFGIKVDDPQKGAAVAKQIDKLFESSEAETLTMSEKAFQLSFLSMYSAILTAMNIVSFVILIIMAMIVGNTIAMGVRERTHEYGVMRAIGFLPRHVANFVIGETLIIALVGGALGIGIAIPLINGFGTFVVDNFGNFFQYFAVSGGTLVLAGVLALLVGLLSASIPSWTVARLNVVSALRRVG
jgi:putative ABC transport system permease protein